MKKLIRFSVTLGFLLSVSIEVYGDTVEARCDIYPKGMDKTSASIACTFSQRQGFINIIRSDGKKYELSPTGDQRGNFLDQSGQPVYRQSSLGACPRIGNLKEASKAEIKIF